jgi:hypothetical protein
MDAIIDPVTASPRHSFPSGKPVSESMLRAVAVTIQLDTSGGAVKGMDNE